MRHYFLLTQSDIYLSSAPPFHHPVFLPPPNISPPDSGSPLPVRRCLECFSLGEILCHAIPVSNLAHSTPRLAIYCLKLCPDPSPHDPGSPITFPIAITGPEFWIFSPPPLASQSYRSTPHHRTRLAALAEAQESLGWPWRKYCAVQTVLQYVRTLMPATLWLDLRYLNFEDLALPYLKVPSITYLVRRFTGHPPSLSLPLASCPTLVFSLTFSGFPSCISFSSY